MTADFEHLAADAQAALATDMTIDITTIGRRTGSARRIEIWFLNIDGQIYIAGTPGPRDWYANLLANPQFVFHLKESARADLDAQASAVTDVEERRRVFHHQASHWYVRQGDAFDDLIATAPLVHITFP